MTGVLLMAYGAVSREEDLEAYFTDIRGGRTPTPEAVEELRQRYRRIGGRSPLAEITRAQARALEEKLNEGPGSFRVFVGMRHWHPFIRETVREEIAASAVEPLVALVLAPHYSKMSIGAYFQRLDEACRQLERPPTVLPVRDYHDDPGFIAAVTETVQRQLQTFGEEADDARQRVKVLFSAHSLPARAVEEGDPYRDQLLASARLVAGACGGLDWEFAFQSASSTGVPWLGPDILEVLGQLADQGYRNVLVVPVGFICDHLEILYDIDVECQETAARLDLNLRRTEMLNDRPSFIDALAGIVRGRLEQGP
ncbi:MAG: ferrochelatase [Acidobacteriota bacterium]